MNALNTHHIPVFDCVFGSFHLVISVFIVIYLILGFLSISSEKCDIWKLCGDLKKKKTGGELSLNVVTFYVATLRLYEVQPTSTHVTTLRRHDVSRTLLTRIFQI